MTRPRHRAGLLIVTLLALAMVAGLVSLGIWQVQRLHWKTGLIARVGAQLAAAPVPAPAPPDWAVLTTGRDEYRRVTVSGTFDPAADTLVRAVTDLGGGYWVMTPLRVDAGWTVWVNRGFVPQDRSAPTDRGQPRQAQISGLLRMSQPDGAFLRANDPALGRWYSRDTQAMADARGVGPVAPYFIDAGAGDPGVLPVGGLTVIRFRNPHLGYALTWFAMAAGLAVACTVLLGREWRRRYTPGARS
ncbi:SURF1 family protein [Paracoccus sp. (in: a-proteobacteria)]|uniref:SURF1 family protein n=1 Tax=Paracoccus sp. TaxID=267 RepID=UPI003A85217A